MKKWQALTLSGLLVASMAVGVSAAINAKVVYSGQESSVAVTNEGGNNFYKARDVANTTGNFVYYDDATQTTLFAEDGVYDAVKVGKYGYLSRIEFRVFGGKLYDVTYGEYQTMGKIADDVNGYRTNFASKMPDKTDHLTAGVLELNERLKAANGKLAPFTKTADGKYPADVMTAATLSHTYDDYYAAAAVAYKAAETAQFADGVYEGASEIIDGYFGFISVAYKDGKVVDAVYDEYATMSTTLATPFSKIVKLEKPNDESYTKPFYAKYPNLDLGRSYTAWAKDLQDNGIVDLTATSDVVTGATHSFQNFKDFVVQALKEGPAHKVGNYNAQTYEYNNGFIYKLSFSVDRNNKFTKVMFDAYNKDGVAKTDPALNYDANYGKTSGYKIADQYKLITDNLLGQTTTAKSNTDVVTGATHSWITFNELVDAALAQGPGYVAPTAPVATTTSPAAVAPTK